MRERTLHCLQILMKNGSMPRSGLGRSAQADLQPLFDAGVLVIVRSGAGEAVRVQHASAVQEFLAVHFPATTERDSAYLSRATAIRRMRNSKRAGAREAVVLLVRAWEPGIEIRLDGARCAVQQLTQTLGVVAMVLRPDTQLEIAGGVVALVENLECFLWAEKLGTAAAGTIYTAGRLPRLVLQKLAEGSDRACRFLHCPDYDPVGLSEYIRYKAVLGERITLFVPDHLQDLLRRYGNQGLMEGRNAVYMQGLRRNAHPELVQLLQWLDEANAGLEQEILIGAV